MSYHIKSTSSIAGYTNPFTGVGVEFYPLGVDQDASAPILHEAGYLPENSNWNFPTVLSPFWRVYYNQDRGHCILLNDESYELLPDHLYMIPSHVLFHCLGGQPVRHFWLEFSLAQRVDSTQAVPIILHPQRHEKEVIDRIIDLVCTQRTPENKKAIYHQSMGLIHLLLSRAAIHWKPPLPKSFSELLQFIDRHSQEPLPNRLLAQKAGMSIASLCRAFQANLQITPALYVNQARIQKAAALLENGEISIDEIAELTGFPNRAYFSRVFKKITAISPAEFRKQKLIHQQRSRPQ